MYWKCTGSIMIANCFEKKKVARRTCHFNPRLWGSASAPSFVLPSRPTPSLTLPLGRAVPVLEIKSSILTTKEKGACKFLPPLKLKKRQPGLPFHYYFKRTLEKIIPFGASWWIPLTGTFLLVPVFLLSPIQAVPWGFCHNNGSSEMVTEHLLTPRKMGLSHYC